MDKHFKTLWFSLISADPRAYLSGRRNDGQSFALAMSQARPGFWFVDVPLSVGTYRMRYYCGDEHHMTYYGPASSNGSWQDGLDAVVVVDAPAPMSAAAIAH